MGFVEGTTVIFFVRGSPYFTSAVAVIVTSPGAIALITPVALSTIAIFSSLDVYVNSAGPAVVERYPVAVTLKFG